MGLGYYTKYAKKCIGKTLVSHLLSDDRCVLTLTFSDGSTLTLDAEGECCSYSWIESIDCPDNLQGVVRAIEEIPMPDLGNIPTPHNADVDEVAYYGLKIITDRGHTVIDYRNSSNGYYGGSLDATFREAK